MDSLVIPATSETPDICFNPSVHELYFFGKCHPENVKGFFNPLINWVKEYQEYVHKEKPEKVTLKLLFTYLNSASLKYLSLFLQTLNFIHQRGVQVDIIWYYYEDDEDIKETGKEFFELTGISANYSVVEKKEEE